jgi:hypothetical protein
MKTNAFSVIALDGDEWSNSPLPSSPHYFRTGVRNRGDHWTRCWLGFIAGMVTADWRIICFACRESNHDFRVIQSVVYILSYPSPFCVGSALSAPTYFKRWKELNSKRLPALWNMMLHDRIHESPPPVPILNLMISAHIFPPPSFSKIHFNSVVVFWG